VPTAREQKVQVAMTETDEEDAVYLVENDDKEMGNETAKPSLTRIRRNEQGRYHTHLDTARVIQRDFGTTD